MRKGFTLIELLVVIAILAVLAVVVVLTLNPAGLLQEARDANRISDMATINNSLGLSLADSSSESLGSANTVYVSIPDPTATTTAGDQCQGLGLFTLPSGYTYQCAASSTYRLTNGTGWIPVNLSNNTFGSSLSELPVDPVNTTSSGLYYTYVMSGTQWEVNAKMEATKNMKGGAADKDGGSSSLIYEQGSNLSLAPSVVLGRGATYSQLTWNDSSLVGYWPLDEGIGSTTADLSGNGNTGTWNGTPTGTSGYYSPGRIGSWAGAFDGTSTYVSTVSSFIGQPIAFSVSMWINLATTQTMRTIFSNYGPSGSGWVVGINDSGSNHIKFYLGSANLVSNSTLNNGAWYNVVATYVGGNAMLYINGVVDATSTATINYAGSPYSPNFGKLSNSQQYFNGLIDDIRIYNRALSAAEITALYNGGK
jgi:prepilin-type N-terminal cleavage/methylation domain-containing protein